jgi:hypothetical protein
MNCLHLMIVAMLVSALARAGDDLPKHAAGETLDFEPKLMLNDVRDSPLLAKASGTASVSDADVRRLEAQVARAKKTAAWREKLFRVGVFSKVQAEQSALAVVRLNKDLEIARRDLARQIADTISICIEADEAAVGVLDAAETELASAEVFAKEASQRWRQAQFDAAQTNLQRQRLLYGVGATTKSQLRRAEEQMAAFKAGENASR